MIGNDPSWRQVIDLAATIAATRTSVLIVGEPGTGKSLLARLIHSLGPNPERPFITVEASALADELSSHEPPDEPYPASGERSAAIGPTSWPRPTAARSISMKWPRCPSSFSSICSASCNSATTRPAPAIPRRRRDARFLMSTSENLPALIEQGRFRQELYHRISVISLMLPPLRHRGTDVELLAESFRAHYAREFHKTVAGFTRDALDVLQKHDWPGNVRELEAAVQRAVALCNGPRITSSHLAPILNHHRQARSVGGATPRPHLKMGVRPLKEALEEPEKRIIIQALQAFNWNRQETARVLDINRTTLYKKMKKYNLLIDEPVWVN